MSTRINPCWSAGSIRLRTGIMGLTLLGAAGLSVAQLIGPDVAVGYADLDINTAVGAEKLYERLQHAAAQVCPQANSQPLAEYRVAIRCRNDVIAHAVNKIKSPQLTAVFTARMHHGPHGAV